MSSDMEYAKDFPVIKNNSFEQPFLYLDNAATTLMPDTVIEKVLQYMTTCGANPYRGASKVAEQATLFCETARETVANFIDAHAHEVIFTKGSTEGLNLVSDLLDLKPTDIIIGSVLEHHANYLPWKMKAKYMSLAINKDGKICLNALEQLLKTNKVKLVSLTYVSNVTGIIQPIAQVIQLAHHYGAKVCIDGAQAMLHLTVSLNQLKPDFFVFSGHKMFAMKGIGILYINQSIQAQLPFKRFGGGMVNSVSKKNISFKKAPLGFEPGTPAVEAIISLGAACDYIEKIGKETLHQHANQWSQKYINQLNQSEYHLIFPDNQDRIPVFTIKHKQKNIDYALLARILSDSFNIIVNDGQQCCGPLYDSVALQQGLRVSAQIYNSSQQVDMFFQALDSLSIML